MDFEPESGAIFRHLDPWRSRTQRASNNVIKAFPYSLSLARGGTQQIAPWQVASEVHVSESNKVERRILRGADVEARCGFKRAHLYKLIRDGKFPRPLRIGIRAVGWDSVDIDQWIAEQLQRRP